MFFYHYKTSKARIFCLFIIIFWPLDRKRLKIDMGRRVFLFSVVFSFKWNIFFVKQDWSVFRTPGHFSGLPSSMLKTQLTMLYYERSGPFKTVKCCRVHSVAYKSASDPEPLLLITYKNFNDTRWGTRYKGGVLDTKVGHSIQRWVLDKKVFHPKLTIS